MSKAYPQFFLLGDSLLEFSTHLFDGFSLAAALQSHYIRRLDVINRGLSGYNTSQALEVLSEIIPKPSCAHIEFLGTLILFGANDACLPDSPTKQHVPLEDYKTNLIALVKHPAVSNHHPKIILVTPPPIDEFRQEEIDASKGNPLCRRAKVTRMYAEAARDVGMELGGDLVVLDLWSAIMDEAIKTTPNYAVDGPILGSKELGESKSLINTMPDGLHFGGKGYQLFFAALLLAIKRKWPDPGPVVDTYVLPEWRIAPKADLRST